MKRSKAAKRSRKAARKKRTKPDDKEAAATFERVASPAVVESAVPVAQPKAVESPVPTAPEPNPVAATPDQSQPVVSSSRSEAARRTAEGKFTKAIFAQVGGTECPRFAAMTWKERDKYMAKSENSVVTQRYKSHMASVGK
jgi:hypothetical protein